MPPCLHAPDRWFGPGHAAPQLVGLSPVKRACNAAGLLQDAGEDSSDCVLVQRRRALSARSLYHFKLAGGVVERQAGGAFHFGERGGESRSPVQKRHDLVVYPVDLRPPFFDTQIRTTRTPTPGTLLEAPAGGVVSREVPRKRSLYLPGVSP